MPFALEGVQSLVLLVWGVEAQGLQVLVFVALGF